MRMGQEVRTGLGHGGITCVLQTQCSSFLLLFSTVLQMVTKFAGVQKCEDKMTLDDSLLILANI